MKKSFFNISGTILIFILIGLRWFGSYTSSENFSDIFSDYRFYIYVTVLLIVIYNFFEGEKDKEE